MIQSSHSLLLCIGVIAFLLSVPFMLWLHRHQPQRMPWWMVAVLAAAFGWLASNGYSYLEIMANEPGGSLDQLIEKPVLLNSRGVLDTGQLASPFFTIRGAGLWARVPPSSVWLRIASCSTTPTAYRAHSRHFDRIGGPRNLSLFAPWASKICYALLELACVLGFLAAVPVLLSIRARRPQRMSWWLVLILALAIGWWPLILYGYLEMRQIEVDREDLARYG